MRSIIFGLLFTLSLQFAGANQNLIFRKLGVQDGLAGANVSCFLQDHNGFMWMATNNGLSRYDGYNFVNYRFNSKDTNSVVNNDILSLLEDNSQTMWIGTVSGLQRYNSSRDNFTYFNLPDGYYSIKTLFQDSRGILWIGSMGGGLYFFNDSTQRVEKYNYKALNYATINAFAEDNKGNMWVGTEYSGVHIFDIKSGEFKNIENIINKSVQFGNKKVGSIAISRDATVWIGTYGNGLYVIDSQWKEIKKAEYGDLLNQAQWISSLHCDSKNNLWIADDGKGLFILNPSLKQLTRYAKNDADKYALSTNSLWSIYEDRNHIFWFGTNSGGVNYTHVADNQSIHIINNTDYPFLINNISSLLSDRNNNLWIGTDGGGLNVIQNGIKSTSKVPTQPIRNLNFDNTLSLLESSDGTIYSGYFLGGLVKRDQKGKNLDILYDKKDGGSFVSNDIRCVTEDRKGNIWVGTNGQGVCRLDKQTAKFTQLTQDYNKPSKGIACNFIRHIEQDSKGYIWICTCNGITRYDEQNNMFINIYSDPQKSSGLCGNFVPTMLESSKGFLYFGTNMGLCKLTTPVSSKKYSDPNITESSDVFKFTTITNSSGLPNDVINSLIEDNNQTIWLGTSSGLLSFDPLKELFKNIEISESDEPCAFNINASAKSANGRLYFGTNKGIVTFHPDSLNLKIAEPDVRITDIKINFEPYKNHQSNKQDTTIINPVLHPIIELSSKDKAITFEFSSLEYNKPRQIQYKYTLVGFDDGWNHTDALRRYATYTNLNPGEYSFNVVATNTEGLWSDRVTKIKIIVSPPFWKYWWFQIMIIVLFAGFVTLYVRIRIHSIEKRKRTLENLVKKRTEELLAEREKQRLQELQNKAMYIKQKELEANNLIAERELMRLRNEKLESEIEQQNNEIIRKNAELAALATQFSQKLEFLSKLKNKLKDLISSLDSKTSPLFLKLIKEIDKDNNLEKEWEQFELHFNQVNNNFLSRLKEKYPLLSPHDLRLCGYLRMNLSTKEIATLFNVSIRGVEKSRSRLKKKLDLNADESITDNILKF